MEEDSFNQTINIVAPLAWKHSTSCFIREQHGDDWRIGGEGITGFNQEKIDERSMSITE